MSTHTCVLYIHGVKEKTNLYMIIILSIYISNKPNPRSHPLQVPSAANNAILILLLQTVTI